jgi:hypothetical protein
MTTPTTLQDEYLILRRKATSAMIDMICQTSPLHAAFRDEGRRQDALFRQLRELRAAGEDIGSISDKLIACNDRLIKLVDLVDWQWGALFDRKAGGVT